MKKILLLLLIIISTVSVLCSPVIVRTVLDLVENCDLVIKGEIIKIDEDDSKVKIDNVYSFRDTAYIKIKSILKKNSQFSHNTETIKLIVPTKNVTSREDYSYLNSSNAFYKVGQDGIWILKDKGEYFKAYPSYSFQHYSKEKYIKLLCDIKQETLKFITDIRYDNLKEVKQDLELALIDINDSIFYYYQSNPILIATLYRRTEIMQDLIDYGFDVNFTNENNENALFLGVRGSRLELDIVETLLKNGINTTIINTKNESIYDSIDKMDNKEELMELFKKYGKEKD